MSIVIIKTVMPIRPVLNQMNTYSESVGIDAIKLYLLFAGTLLDIIPIPIPHGASFIYFLIVSWLISLVLDEASLLSNAEARTDGHGIFHRQTAGLEKNQ